MALQWTANLATGVSEIDLQHQELFKRLNALLTAMSQGKGKEEIEQVLNFLGEYITCHFSTEEKYMRDHNYPGFESHQAQHLEFSEYYAILKERFKEEGAASALVIQTQRHLSDWWSNHIGESDRELGIFLKQR